VKVGLRVPRVVKVDHHVHRHYVDTPSEEVCAYQASSVTVFKIVVNPIQKTRLYLMLVTKLTCCDHVDPS
jgi:hypothetical protein